MATNVKKQTGFWATVKEMVVLLLIVFIVRTIGFGLYQVPTGSMETTVLVGERFFADKFTLLFKPLKRGDVIAFNEPETLFNYSANPIVNFFQQYVWGPRNLTKRIIGLPGDHLRGTIENGKPVIYLNGKVLEEPYLNKYPLIAVQSDSPEKIEKMSDDFIAELLFTRRIDSTQINDIKNQLKQHFVTWRSYDPAVPLDKQPFYRIKPEEVVKGPDGMPLMRQPYTVLETPKPDKIGKNVWGHNSDEFDIELGPNEYWCMGDNRLGSGDSRSFGPVNGKFIHGKIIFRIWSIDSDESWWIVDLIKHPIDFWSRVRWSRFFDVVR
jgi:signal peptidase I